MAVHQVSSILGRVLIAIDGDYRVFWITNAPESCVESLHKITGGSRGPSEEAHLIRLENALDHPKFTGISKAFEALE